MHWNERTRAGDGRVCSGGEGGGWGRCGVGGHYCTSYCSIRHRDFGS